MTAGIFRLLTQHQRLDEQLRIEQTHRLPDTKRVVQLKKLKLAVKDRLHQLSLGKREQRFA
jgi:uncharacterized protein YdcH (DUF465 family)